MFRSLTLPLDGGLGTTDGFDVVVIGDLRFVKHVA